MNIVHTTETKKAFTDVDAALKYVRNLKGITRFSLIIEVALPTSETRYLPGMAGISVSKKTFMQVIDQQRNLVGDDRNGHIVIRTSTDAPLWEGHKPLVHVSIARNL